jgi:AcrR family transcriptional regulator
MRAATHEALISSAMMLFARQGYAHTSTRSIARDAGISTGLMYHYFDDKESLLRAVFEHCMATLSATFVDALEGGEPGARLDRLLRAIFDTLARDAAFWSLFYMLRTQPAIMSLLGDDFRLWTERLRNIFTAELQTRGRADPEMDALLLYALVEGTIQQYLLEPQGYPLDRVADRIIAQYGAYPKGYEDE